jgi:hypothetical protein
MKSIFLTIALIFCSYKISAQTVQVDDRVARLINEQIALTGRVILNRPHKDIWKDQPYRLIPLHSDYEESDKDGYEYLSSSKRNRLKVKFQNGRLYTSDGREIDTHNLRNGGAPYVMDKNGNIYLTRRWEVWKFEHHSIMAGQPVVCAGRMIVHNGILKGVDDFSPNYRSNNYYALTKVVSKLEEHKVPKRKVQVMYRSDTANPY